MIFLYLKLETDGDVATLTRPTVACPLCQEERCAEDGVREVLMEGEGGGSEKRGE